MDEKTLTAGGALERLNICRMRCSGRYFIMKTCPCIHYTEDFFEANIENSMGKILIF